MHHRIDRQWRNGKCGDVGRRFRLDNSSQISIRIGAKDASGLAKTSKYRVFAQGKTYDGVLRFNRARKRYQGTGEFPKLPVGEAWKFEFQIADNAGNVSKLEYVQ